jgi:hypothetical protein
LAGNAVNSGELRNRLPLLMVSNHLESQVLGSNRYPGHKAILARLSGVRCPLPTVCNALGTYRDSSHGHRCPISTAPSRSLATWR